MSAPESYGRSLFGPTDGHYNSEGRGRRGTGIELGESTALFSLASDGGGEEGRGEESRFYWISPLPNPLPARSSQGEGDRRPAFQCLIQWQSTPSPYPMGRGWALLDDNERWLPLSCCGADSTLAGSRGNAFKKPGGNSSFTPGQA